MDKLERFAPTVGCKHNLKNWQASPYNGDVWCFKCNPPRNLSDDYRCMTEALDTLAQDKES